MKYETVIGIEIHCELKTKTKMFSSAPVAFGEVANTCVNEVDLGHPGTLPCVNKEAVRLAVKAATALRCDIDPLVKFDRKNYYYSDLPKGFQITQQFHPIGRNGCITIETEDGKKDIRINRIHMEEDTAKQFHSDAGTLIDFNRAGTPLVEIVSEADMRSGSEAAAYVEKLRTLLYYLGVSDVKMEEGSMRCDVNVSIRPVGSTAFGTKTEVKNLNSISNVQKAIDAEVERQIQLVENGEKVEQATRRYDETQKTTILMRKKEGNVDYKFFPEPNITPIRLSDEWISEIQENMEELPDERKSRYMGQNELSAYDADVLVSNRELSDFYDEVIKHTKAYKKAANWVIVELSAALNKANIKPADNPCKAEYLADMINMVEAQEISGKQAKVVFEEIMKGKDPKKVVEEKGMKQMSDASELLAMINTVLDNNPQSIEDFKNGKDRAVGFLVGQVMKASKGQANPAMTNKLIQEELKKR
ncbi:Asp-tRNA(Asn)/Glu-tRNA(Gln) amidotransferase subunit GatB [Amedibacterium intestinale]|jgi:aspartyl/glutamyl-tRNA(asn/gln) amidotransferase, B subunit|uniref:Asp-tRNA(Asn)/Glu-tRNA(Gln) amidotransferase subunit GatB n=1 Tax=Amedibacterium intestinale TaxID=2583452 RepID=UPI000E5363FA|nr:Asp-tRNA(Asn)/Glu-tRNA(Gln) amidotransferase subunit GatB [Amedibacterium intestinale]RHO30488.1 Asp-tRNA(Asn)/Glu-tRNA(Gln) amidotransferase subunit GatB [Erysipelotrichaceae bacterium AM17-60]